MSLYDYEQSKQLVSHAQPNLNGEPTFTALIMAAYRKADTDNATRLKALFPGIVTELEARYNAPRRPPRERSGAQVMRSITDRGPLPVYNWLAHYQGADPRHVDATIVADAGITHAIVGATSDREARRRASVALSGLDVWFTKSDTERHDIARLVVDAFHARLSKTLVRSA